MTSRTLTASIVVVAALLFLTGSTTTTAAAAFVSTNNDGTPLTSTFRPQRRRQRSFKISQPLHSSSSSSSNSPVDEEAYRSPLRKRPPPLGGDVAYTAENIHRQLAHYNSIKKVGGADCVLDAYVRDPGTGGKQTRYWFVGKVARCTGTVSPEASVARQYNFLEEHACRIRPVELGRAFGRLEVWTAPGDSELAASDDESSTELTLMARDIEGGCDGVNLLEVGLSMELVTNRGVGFSIVRTDMGRVSGP